MALVAGAGMRHHHLVMNTFTIRKSNERGQADHGWLLAKHSFSFADYYDPKHMHFRTLRVINEDRLASGQGFGTHPHRDMEIITYILNGQLQHKDSMGNGRIIETGDFQYMAAGTGVQHSEFNPSKSNKVHLLQIWIMPDAKGVKPRYAEKPMAKAEPGKLHLVTSKTGRDDSMEIHQDSDLYLARFDGGEEVTHTIKTGRGGWLQVAEGSVTLNGTTLEQGDAASLDAKEDTVLTISSTGKAQVLLFDLA
ncbi:MAG: Pirin domain protein [Verrucomicrobiaceae bacterium]|nr:Pirin domain protein [Verrucomicrobiaceae bacterium]